MKSEPIGLDPEYIARCTFQDLWELYVEPSLDAQKGLPGRGKVQSGGTVNSGTGRMTLQEKREEMRIMMLSRGTSPADTEKYLANLEWPLGPERRAECLRKFTARLETHTKPSRAKKLAAIKAKQAANRMKRKTHGEQVQ